MGKRRVQRKNSAKLDSDDDNCSVISSSTVRSDQIPLSGAEGAVFYKDILLDEAVDALFEKRGSTREKALEVINAAFSFNLQNQFVENKFATILHQCLNCIKKGSSKEIALASRSVGLLALTVGPGDNAHKILKESIDPLSQAFKSCSESSKIISLLNCLAVITFVGGNDPEEIENSMQIMQQLVHPKLSSNVITVKPTAAVITAAVSAWSFLLTTMDGWRLSPKQWQESVTYLSSLLDKDDRSVRIAAGEALALIFERGSLEKFACEAKGSCDGSASEGNKSKGFSHMHGLKEKILNQVRDLSVEAGGKGSSKKDLNNQRSLFKDVLEFLEYDFSPETSMKIGEDTLHTSTWSKLIQLNFLKRFLGGGFTNHAQNNEFVQDVFRFTPKRQNLVADEHISNFGKRIYKSPNSVVNKARTQQLNKQRMLSEGRNFGHFAICVGYEDF
ncbi:interferon-related developmental regulator 1-like [Hibiscus syriacus]|uniref:interferon-related developmental regulator 1-like n=1 Tax=Hibiscus syriacus TaxID=106335 RepID=UPI001921DB76|nr:interferon-related developmental regulator 1-like [Hibiscus syriacus]